MGKTLGARFPSSFYGQTNTTDAFNNYFKDQPKNNGKSFSIGKQGR